MTKTGKGKDETFIVHKHLNDNEITMKLEKMAEIADKKDPMCLFYHRKQEFFDSNFQLP